MKAFSFRQLFSILFILFVGLLAATALSAWTGPTATAPDGNITAPINVGTTDQVKNAGLSVNALTVFGSEYVQNKLGIGQASPVTALDVNGSIKIANGGELCQAVSEGTFRYNASTHAPEYCNGTAWTALESGSGSIVNLSAIRTFTSGTNATYTAPANISYLVAEVWGAGGGGSGYGFGGSAGSSSCFGTNATACTSPILSASGGGGGQASGTSGTGGSGSGGDVNITGGVGGGGDNAVGGSAPRGGGGGPFGTAGSAFGGGGGGPPPNGVDPAAGGGGGGYAEKLIAATSGATYHYTIGTGGTGASYGGSGTPPYGGNGGAGAIVIYEYTTQ